MRILIDMNLTPRWVARAVPNSGVDESVDAAR
jgi:hypothetical protein